MKFSSLFKEFLIPVTLLLSTDILAQQEEAYKESKTLVELSSASLRAIEATLPEFRRENSTWQSYEIELSETTDTYRVVFWKPEKVGTINFVYPEGYKKAPGDPDKIVEKHGAVNFIVDKRTFEIKNIIHAK